MKNVVISNITHALRMPLSNIKSYVNLLESEMLSNEKRKEYISIVEKERNRLSNLSKQLLLLSSLEQEEGFDEKKWFNVSEQIKEVIYNQQWHINERGIMISYSLQHVEINGDPSLLYDVWENLLTNAIKYNEQYGEIRITVEKNKNDMSVQFHDTGIGFSEEAKEQLFERFYREDKARTRNIEGSGLGLSIVKSVIELHNGSIEVESNQGKGTRFIIHLPV